MAAASASLPASLSASLSALCAAAVVLRGKLGRLHAIGTADVKDGVQDAKTTAAVPCHVCCNEGDAGACMSCCRAVLCVECYVRICSAREVWSMESAPVRKQCPFCRARNDEEKNLPPLDVVSVTAVPDDEVLRRAVPAPLPKPAESKQDERSGAERSENERSEAERDERSESEASAPAPASVPAPAPAPRGENAANDLDDAASRLRVARAALVETQRLQASATAELDAMLQRVAQQRRAHQTASLALERLRIELAQTEAALAQTRMDLMTVQVELVRTEAAPERGYRHRTAQPAPQPVVRAVEARGVPRYVANAWNAARASSGGSGFGYHH